MDLFFLLVVAAFFGLALLIARGCEWLLAADSGGAVEHDARP
jgi:hypothetical protein